MLTTDQRRRWGLHTPSSLKVRAQQLGSAEYLIQGILPVCSIGLLLGDSGLGKSPLMYQAAICIASGLPFLGRETRKGSVLIADFENRIGDMYELIERVSRHLGLPGPPGENLVLWSLNDCPPKYGQPGDTLLDMLRALQPSLAIVDSLSSYAPEAEEKNSDATEMLQDFRSIARECRTGVMLVHHRRKQSRKVEESAGPLENAVLRRWFQDARGASSLINGSDIRLGIDEPDIGVVGKDNASLVCRGFGRIRGEIGPIYLAREVDDVGDPLGYRHLIGPELLFNPKQEAALAALPSNFAFKEAMAAYGHADQATSNFLRRCITHLRVRRVARGRYEKIEAQDARIAGASGV
jgi:hypothetical protein